MKITSRIKLGQDEFELSMDVADEREFFQQMSFYSSLPRTAPNGADDLKVRFRTTKDGDTYYSLVSETEKMEFKLGQQKKDDRLFPKGWEPLYQGADSEDGQGQAQATPASVAKSMPKVNTATPAATAAPAATSMPKVTPAAMPKATEAPAQATTPAAAPAQVNPAVASAAASVLSRFNKKA